MTEAATSAVQAVSYQPARAGPGPRRTRTAPDP